MGFALYCSFWCCRMYTCHFDEIRHDACECRIQVAGFVITETFTVNVSKGDEIWHTETINTEESSKWITVCTEGCVTSVYSCSFISPLHQTALPLTPIHRLRNTFPAFLGWNSLFWNWACAAWKLVHVNREIFIAQWPAFLGWRIRCLTSALASVASKYKSALTCASDQTLG